VAFGETSAVKAATGEQLLLPMFFAIVAE